MAKISKVISVLEEAAQMLKSDHTNSGPVDLSPAGLFVPVKVVRGGGLVLSTMSKCLILNILVYSNV